MDNSKWGSGASGAASGAAVGTSILPGWGTAIGAVVGGVGGFLFGGSGESDAITAAEQSGIYNAAMSEIYGSINANRVQAAANISAQSQIMGAEVTALGNEAVAMFNAEILAMVTDYNNEAYDKETDLIWDAYELDSHQRDIVERKTEGSYQALSGASGVEMGISGDSNTLGLLDMKTQFALDQFVIKRNAHIQAGKIQDAKALGAWEGAMEINKMMYEGKISSLITRTAGISGAGQSVLQGALDSSTIRSNAKMNADLGMYNTNFQTNQISRGANQDMMDGFLSAAGTVATTYAGSPKNTPGSTLGGTSISGYNARSAHNYNASGNTGVGTYFKG